MAFVDSLLEHSDADVVMVERRHRPGGHWLDAYPFVQLHQPSRYYGVDSTPLGLDRPEPEGDDTDFRERASGAEICGYYDEIMRHRFLGSGRVRFFPMCEYLGERRFRSRVSGDVSEVTVRTAGRRRDVHGVARAGHGSAAVHDRRRCQLRPCRRADRPRGAAGRIRDRRRGQDRARRDLLVARPGHRPRRDHLDPSARHMGAEPGVLPARRRADLRVRRPPARSDGRVRDGRGGLRAPRGRGRRVPHRPDPSSPR